MEGLGNITMEEVSSFPEFMHSIESQVRNAVKNNYIAPESFLDHVYAFAAAINWKEPFILCLLGFHIFLIVFTITTRKIIPLQAFIFVLIAVFVALSERLNSFAQENWKEFSTQDYFDRHGVFTSIMYSAPMLCVAFFQLVSFIFLMASLHFMSYYMSLFHGTFLCFVVEFSLSNLHK